ncbi:MAG: hypothetical protein RLZZ511_4019 [Cyanobacteriota bacterium]|jgi:Protein of unknown function (DUF2281)
MLSLETAIQKIQQLPPEQRNKVIEYVEFLEYQAQHAAPSANQPTEPLSFATAAQEFAGCLDSDLEDLSHNPQYLQGFGQS